MPALNDGRCGKCGKRYGWEGEITDMPPCPRCGDVPDVEELKADQAVFEKARAEMLAEFDRKGK